MAATLSQLSQRIDDLDKLADEVRTLADRKFKQEDVQGNFPVRGSNGIEESGS